MDRSREKFLPDLFTKLNQYGDHQSGSSLYGAPPLCVHRVKITFANEPGEGSGVLRSLFTAMAEVSEWVGDSPYIVGGIPCLMEGVWRYHFSPLPPSGGIDQ